MSGDFCKTEQVTLQENGIVRNAGGRIIGHLVEDVDELCGRHNKIGYKQGYRAGKADAQRQWVGLTDEEIRKVDHHMVEGAYHYSFKQGAEWAEAKLKEKNT